MTTTFKPRDLGIDFPTIEIPQFEFFGGRLMIYSSTLHLERSFWPRLHQRMETWSDGANRNR